MKLNKLIVILGGISSFCFADIDTNKYLSCFIKASQYYNVPQQILQAIAYVESKYNPNAYNENSNHSYDIGLMQINSTWLPKLKTLGITEDMLYDPCQSIAVGAWVLANNIQTYGLNWGAVQRYNGNDVELKYATKVYNRIQETYPELLNQSQVKLIPITDKKAIKKQAEIVSQSPNLKVNQFTATTTVVENKLNQKHSNNEQDVDTILRNSGVKISSNQANKKESVNVQVEESINEILLKGGVSTALVKTQKPNKNIVENTKVNDVKFNQLIQNNLSVKPVITLQQVVVESKVVVAKIEDKSQNVMQSGFNDFNVFFNDCRDGKVIKNNVTLCQVYPISFIKKIPNIDIEINKNLIPNPIVNVAINDVKKKSKFTKKNKKVYAKKEHSTTATMLAL